jgi:transketolase
MIATRDVYGETLARLGETNRDIVVLDADLSGSTKTAVFAKRFPDRFFNMGVAEQDMMGTAAGLATAGKIPFVSTFAIFASGRAWEQVRQSVAYPKLNVKIVASHAGITVGEDGASHQSLEDIAVMRAIPGMTVIVPADGVETGKAIEEIVRCNGPVYLRVSRGKSPVLLDDSYEFEIGKGVVLRDGADVSILACGIMVSRALDAADILKREGLSARVINIPTIKPLDTDLVIKAARETGAVVAAEEHSIIGGLGSAVAEVLAENFPVPLKRIGTEDRFGTSGDAERLLEIYGLTSVNIAKAAREVAKKKQKVRSKE